MKYTVKCKKCGKEFIVECSENQFKKGNYRQYCCSGCSHSHTHSKETKQKISETLKQKGKKTRICRFCGASFIPKGKEKFCCETCKEHFNRVRSLIKFFGFNELLLSSSKAYDEIQRIHDLLYDDYWIKEMTSKEIIEKYGYPSQSNLISKIFKYLGIPVRNCAEASVLNVFKGRNFEGGNKMFKSEWHMTWDGKKVYLRSSYETEYANELDEQKIRYEVESLRIRYWNTQKNMCCCAIPDFYLPDLNTIVEIKSSYTLDVQVMKDKALAYAQNGYQFKLILDHKELNINKI